MAGVCNTCMRTTRTLSRGMCPLCQPVNDRRRRPSGWARYGVDDQGENYQTNRAIVLEGEPECHWGCGRPADTADHHPLKRVDGGGHGLDNLVPACGPCNSGRR